jgi:lysozyme family protein
VSLFDLAFAEILKVEGETYTNHPNDKGGPTKFGITLKLFQDTINPDATAASIESLTKETARSIYKSFFWYRLQLDRLGETHPEIALIVFDQAVNRGTFGAARMVQRAINDVWKQKIVEEDGVFGPKTLSEIKKLPTLQIGFQLIKNAQISYVRIVKNNPDQLVFLEGWINRTHFLLDKFLKKG